MILRAGNSRRPKSTAAGLLGEFGTLHAVLAATGPQLTHTAGCDPAGVQAIQAFRAAMMHALAEPFVRRPLIDEWPALTTYLRAGMTHSPIENARVIFLDTRLRLIRDEVMWTGTVDQVMFHAREVIGRAIELGAAAMILVHNHPSGIAEPSRSDVRLTRDVREVARKLGIDVIDHLVVGGEEVVSMRSNGLI